jgi:hypothetical protein
MTSVEYGYITSPDKYIWKDDDGEIPIGTNGRIRYAHPVDPSSDLIIEIMDYAKERGYGVARIEVSDPLVVVPFPVPEPTMTGAIVETVQGFRFIRTERGDKPWLRVNKYQDNATPNFLSWRNIDTPAKVNLPTDKA